MALAQATAPDSPQTEPHRCSSPQLTPEQWDTVQANTGLIRWTISRWWAHPDVDVEDAFQDGLFGLAHAVTCYDPSRGAKFSTHAIWWIRSAISRGHMTSEGSGYRRARTNHLHWERPRSLDELVYDDGNETIGDQLVEPDLRTDPPPPEAIVASEIAWAACRNDFDRRILEALEDGRGAVCVARDLGYHPSAAAKRVQRMRARIAKNLAALTAEERDDLAVTVLNIEETRL